MVTYIHFIGLVMGLMTIDWREQCMGSPISARNQV